MLCVMSGAMPTRDPSSNLCYEPVDKAGQLCPKVRTFECRSDSLIRRIDLLDCPVFSGQARGILRGACQLRSAHTELLRHHGKGDVARRTEDEGHRDHVMRDDGPARR
jgi:hypothetical protein